MAKRKILVMTGSRAEYGLLYWLIKEISNDPDLQLQLLVTAMHLSTECGLTYKRIEEDGFPIDQKIEMLLASDTHSGITKSMGVGLIGFADAYARLKPDLLVVLGDRYEALVAVQAAMIAKIPIAHLHGGELTRGVIDEGIRHAITKMAHLHFVAAERYAERVIQMGENPDFVFNFGAPGLDHITQTPLLSKSEFEEVLDFQLTGQTFLVTYHPVTLSQTAADVEMQVLLDALDQFPDAKIIFTYPNQEVETTKIIQKIKEYLTKNPKKGKCYIALGFKNYLSAVQHVDLVVGNSSSGLIEVPYLKTASVNIGDRQTGRLSATSVVHCELNQKAIVGAIHQALSAPFQKSLANMQSPYGSGNASVRIKDVLKKIDLTHILCKEFYDIKQ